MEEMQQAINAVTSPAVQLWMNWMLAVFLISVLFVWKHPPARSVLAVFILSALLGLMIFRLSGEPHLIGLAHLLLWGPLACYLFAKVIRSADFNIKSLFGIWIILLLATIVISLLFDVRDVALVMLGMR